MNFVTIIEQTPWWVWPLLAYLIFVGLKACKQRIVYIPQLFIIPMIMMAINYKRFFPESICFYGLGLLLGICSGIFAAQLTKVTSGKNRFLIQLPGSPSLLVLLLLFFIEKYAFGYLSATQSPLPHHFIIFDLIISGLVSGFLLGKAIWFLYQAKYKKKI